MLLLLEKLIKNGIKKDFDFTIETYLNDVLETDTGGLEITDIKIFFNNEDKFILGTDTITLSWLKDILNEYHYFSIYNKLNTIDKIDFIKNSMDVLYNSDNLILTFVLENESDITVKKAIASEIKKLNKDNDSNYFDEITLQTLLSLENDEV